MRDRSARNRELHCEGTVSTMASLTSLLIEPFYRMAYGVPLIGHATPSALDREGGSRCQRGLVVVVDGVGGLDLCGTALRYVLGAEKLPYAIQVFRYCRCNSMPGPVCLFATCLRPIASI